ncbi:DUF982 domain-containing protein [Aliihoeflea sp. PC F10.4]
MPFDEEKPFDQPVRVFADAKGGVAKILTTTAQAAQFLLDDWPANNDTRKHLAARKACIAVLEGIKDARAARKAFEAAADEANILLKPLPIKTRGTDGPTLWNKRTRKLKRDR